MPTVHLAMMSCCLQVPQGLLECWHDSWHCDQGTGPLGAELHRGLCSAQVSSPCWPVRVTYCIGLMDLRSGCYQVAEAQHWQQAGVVGPCCGTLCHAVLCAPSMLSATSLQRAMPVSQRADHPLACRLGRHAVTIKPLQCCLQVQAWQVVGAKDSPHALQPAPQQGPCLSYGLAGSRRVLR